MNDMSILTDEELLDRWGVVATDFKRLTDEVMPTILKLSKLERELLVLKEEILKRGMRIEKEND